MNRKETDFPCWIAGAFLILWVHAGNAMDRPEWVDTPPPENAQYKFYLGRASDAKNESTGFNEAFRAALENAIQENFGFRTRVDKQSYSTNAAETTTKRIQEISRNVEMHGYEQQNSFQEQTSDGRVNVWVLFRYKKSAIEAEKIRQAKVKEDETQITFNEAGNAADKSKGALEVVTLPQGGAQINIDNVPVTFLETPLRIYGRIPIGKHKLRIDHERYEAVEQDIVIVPGTTTRVHVTLLKALARIRIVTIPANANAIVNGRPAGVTPTESIEVPAAEPIKVEISHAECESVSRIVTPLERGDSKTIEEKLVLKPAYIVALASDPRGAQILLGEQSIGETPLRKPFKIEAGHRMTITLRKDGYHDKSVTVEAKGGERLMVPLQPLSSIAEAELEAARKKKEEERRQEEDRIGEQERSRREEEQRMEEKAAEQEQRENPPWLFEMDIIKAGGNSFGGADLSFLDLAAERHFGFIGMRLGLGLLGFSMNSACWISYGANNPPGYTCGSWYASGSAGLPFYVLRTTAGQTVNRLAIVPGVEAQRGGVVDNRATVALEYQVGGLLLRGGAVESLTYHKTSFYGVFGIVFSGL